MKLQEAMQASASALSTGSDFAGKLLGMADANATYAKKPRDSLQSATDASMTVSMDMLLQDSLQQMQQWLNINDLQVQKSKEQGGSNGTP